MMKSKDFPQIKILLLKEVWLHIILYSYQWNFFNELRYKFGVD